MAATFHSAPILGISLWAVLRPSLTPVRILMVRGISPRARFIPIRIFPNFPAASSTVIVESEACQTFCSFQNRHCEVRTGRTTACSKDKVDWTTTVQVHKVDAAVAFSRYHFGRGDKRGRLASCNLYPKHFFGRVSSDQGPLFFGARQKGCR